MPEERYDHKEIEPKWQKVWEERKAFAAEDFSDKEKFYALVEFPYPSGAGLHVGHVRSYTALDALSRKKRQEGKNVLYPIGWDAFGLPTENYAIKTGIHPRKATNENIDTFRRQLRELGLSYDWDREVDTTDPGYYKWTQWLFLKFYEKGLAYKTQLPINWCPACKIGLANEEVIDGKCERCGAETTKKEKEQWMLAITKYADRLLDDLSPPSCFILHGWGASSQDNWFPWARERFDTMGCDVSVPDFPSSETPKYEEWKAHFHQNYADKLRTNSVIFGHSLGNQFILRYLSEEDVKIGTLVLVAPPKDNCGIDEIANFFDADVDWEKVKSAVREIQVIGSDDDEYISKEDFQSVAKSLGADFELSSGRGHFNDTEISELEPVFEKVEANIIHYLDKIRIQQQNWIGRSEGCDVGWKVDGSETILHTYTTTVDTIYGVTFVVISPEHPELDTLVTSECKAEVDAYVSAAKKKPEIDRTAEGKEKTGVNTGAFVVHPFTGEKVPLWVADYVLMSYGTGVVMGVPAHDQRDMDFAQKYDFPVVQSIQNTDGETFFYDNVDKYKVQGTIIDSGEFTGLPLQEGRKVIVEALEKKNLGAKKVQCKLRDWVFSRQRYWGEPIPIIHCDKCGEVPVPEKDLPVELPEVEEYLPTDEGESPLARVPEWVATKCPKCGEGAKPETDTMPNWAGSSWYFMRYIDPKNDQAFADPEKLKYWMPVTLYNGGMEHTTLHLLYSRFWNKFLYDCGLVPTSEPYARRHSHGMILAEDGRKMSKSFGNVVNPDTIIEEFGADTLRVYEMFMGPFGQAIAWDSNAVVGVRKFLERVWRVFQKPLSKSQDALQVLHETIKVVGEHIDEFRFNTAISQLMILTNELTGLEEVSKETLEKYAMILSPFAPHLAEECWANLGHKDSLAYASWPEYDESLLVQDTVIYAVQINGKVRADFEVAKDAEKEEVLKQAKSIEKIQKYLNEGEVVKEIFVPGKIIGFVVRAS